MGRATRYNVIFGLILSSYTVGTVRFISLFLVMYILLTVVFHCMLLNVDSGLSINPAYTIDQLS